MGFNQHCGKCAPMQVGLGSAKTVKGVTKSVPKYPSKGTNQQSFAQVAEPMHK
jgi:hypothetical protein